jgi:hypothetical protein
MRYDREGEVSDTTLSLPNNLSAGAHAQKMSPASRWLGEDYREDGGGGVRKRITHFSSLAANKAREIVLLDLIPVRANEIYETLFSIFHLGGQIPFKKKIDIKYK